MKTTLRFLGLAGALALAVSIMVSRVSAESSGAAATPKPAQLERGHYLVFRTGLCIDCHSPRNAKGEFIAEKHLTGAPIGVAPLAPMPWMPAAPRIAGLPAGYSPDEFVHFLMTGERPQGRGQPLPPMPPYRFNREDAEAITAFLRSLPSQ